MKRKPPPRLSHRDLAAATAAKQAFTRAGWIFELKYDGFRVLAAKEGDAVSLVSRKGTDLLPRYPEIGTALRALPDLVLDGELVILDKAGRPQFERLSRRLRLKRAPAIAQASRADPAAIFAFDLLALEGRDLRALPLLKRKQRLKAALKGHARIRYTEHIGEEGERLYAMAERLGLEGIVAKRADAPYVRGRTAAWLKIKTPAGRALQEERGRWML